MHAAPQDGPTMGASRQVGALGAQAATDSPNQELRPALTHAHEVTLPLFVAASPVHQQRGAPACQVHSWQTTAGSCCRLLILASGHGSFDFMGNQNCFLIYVPSIDQWSHEWQIKNSCPWWAPCWLATASTTFLVLGSCPYPFSTCAIGHTSIWTPMRPVGLMPCMTRIVSTKKLFYNS